MNSELLGIVVSMALLGSVLGTAGAGETKSLEQLRQEYLQHRFGLFMCLGIATYHELEWATGQEPAESFNPAGLDCEQWAKAAKSMGAQYGMFTTKHVGGFALWDTDQSEYDVAAGPYGKDIVRQYVDAFRKEGLKIGLYFSVWDRHHAIARAHVTPEKVAHVKAQLRDLLSNYGKIDLLWLDAYQSEKRTQMPAGTINQVPFPTTKEVPYEELYALIKELQPECLVMRHPGMGLYDTSQTDVQIWEGIFVHKPTRDAWVKYQKEHPDLAQEVCDTLQQGWYWKKAMPDQELKSVDFVADAMQLCLSHGSNFVLNVAVNRQGQFDENALQRLQEIGAAVRERGLLEQDRDAVEPVEVFDVGATGGEEAAGE